MLEIKKTLNIVEDATPELGGDLDVNSHAIVSANDGNIEITTDGTGSLNISAAGMTVTGKSTGNLVVKFAADSTRAAVVKIDHGASKQGFFRFQVNDVVCFDIRNEPLTTETLSFIPYIDNEAKTALTTTMDYNTGKWDFPADVEVSDDLVVGDDCDVVGGLTAGTIQADNGASGTYAIGGGLEMVVVGGIITTVQPV